MPHGNDCPNCGEIVGIWAVFKAPVPNRIYCPHCGERLRYGGTGMLIVAFVVLTLATAGCAVAAFAAAAIEFKQPVVPGAVALGIFVLGGVLLEVAFVALLWYGGYRLEPVNRPKYDWDDF